MTAFGDHRKTPERLSISYDDQRLAGRAGQECPRALDGVLDDRDITALRADFVDLQLNPSLAQWPSPPQSDAAAGSGRIRQRRSRR